MKKFLRVLSNSRFWYIVTLFLVCTAFHYPEQLPWLGRIEINSFLGLKRHAVERIFFLAPITFAVFSFGRNAGIISLVVACGVMLPRILLISPYPKDALFETCTVIVMGISISWWLESRRREIGQREQAVLKLEAARRQLQSYVERIKEDEKQLQKYASQISRAHEEERKRIARELHDDTIQTMVAVSRHLDTLATESSSLPSKFIESLERVRKDIDESLIRARRFIQDLRPPTLEYLGLVPALRELASQVHGESGIRIDLKVSGPGKHFTTEESLLIYRIIQEAIRNVWRHSGATFAEINMKFDNGQTTVTIIDNGNGFEFKHSAEFIESGKLGLMGMKERSHLLGGNMDIVSKPNHGTTVTLKI